MDKGALNPLERKPDKQADQGSAAYDQQGIKINKHSRRGIANNGQYEEKDSTGDDYGY